VLASPVRENAVSLVVSCRRAALKNHRRSLSTGPPSVPSQSFPSSSGCVTSWAASNGVTVLQAGLSMFSRRPPEKVLPPLRVMAFTTPPVNRPYSAGTPEVSVCTSWMASSMNRSWG
jgi:hypothetical protein